MEDSRQNEETGKPLSEEEQKAIWLKELEENEAIQNYFAQYEADSISHFKDYYLRKKGHWMETWPGYEDEKEDFGFKWVDIAFEHLKIILQKKLFGVQCLWRAEQIEIEALETSYEFSYWEENILNCPFIEPVTIEELELYISFLKTTEFEADEDFFVSWQNHKQMKKAFNDEDDRYYNYPEWYDFYDIRTGSNILFTLPDTRGEKEMFYINLSWSEERRKCEEAQKATMGADEKNTDNREWLEYHSEAIIRWFVKTFETEAVKTSYENYNWALRNSSKREHLQIYLDLLYEAEEDVPVKSNKNWMDGIRIAADKYKKAKIIEALYIAWEQYKVNIEAGIGFPISDHSIKNDDPHLMNYFREHIIEGRILNGEPGDLDF